MKESQRPSDSLTVTKVFGIVALVAVIAITAAALLIPNFAGSERTSPKHECIDNLRRIDGAKQTWAFENDKSKAEIPTWTDIESYLGRSPTDHIVLKCPSGGTYTLGAVSNKPTCSIQGHTLP